MVQGKINRSRHTDHLAGCHSIQTYQCLPPPSSNQSLIQILRILMRIKLQFYYILRESQMMRNVYWSCMSVSVSVCPSLHAHRHNTAQTQMQLGEIVGGALQFWADLQQVHGFHCYDNIILTRNVSECLYSLYAWLLWYWFIIKESVKLRIFKQVCCRVPFLNKHMQSTVFQLTIITVSYPMGWAC